MGKLKCEIWKDIPGYEGLYQASNTGLIRSVSHYARNNKNGGIRRTKGQILSPYKMPNGYLQVQLSEGKKKRKYCVHRLVALAFLDNKESLSDVNHIDGNKEHNNVENLEWCTHKDNQIHMIKNFMTKKAKPLMCVETNEIYSSLMEAERATGIERHKLRKICESGERFEGCHWRLVV